MRLARMGAGLTQLALAEAVGVKEHDITRYETGRAQPNPGIALRISRALNTDVNRLFPSLGLMVDKEV